MPPPEMRYSRLTSSTAMLCLVRCGVSREILRQTAVPILLSY